MLIEFWRDSRSNHGIYVLVNICLLTLSFVLNQYIWWSYLLRICFIKHDLWISSHRLQWATRSDFSRPSRAQTFTIQITRLLPEHTALSALVSTHFTCSCAIKILLSNWIFPLAVKAGRVNRSNRLVHKFTAVLGTILPEAWVSRRICEWSTTSLQLMCYTSATSPTADSVLDTSWFSVLGLTAEKSHTFNWTIDSTILFFAWGMSLLTI